MIAVLLAVTSEPVDVIVVVVILTALVVLAWTDARR